LIDKILILYISWDPSPELLSWKLPLLQRPILWYGFFFALGFALAYLLFKRLLKEFLHPYGVEKKEVDRLAERLSFSVVLGTVLGARLGDRLFYQSPLDYVHNPLEFFKFWEPGLSSHGGIVGILVGLALFSIRVRKSYPMLTFVALLDLLALPGLLAGGFIRIGNFFNQEILGKVTTLPWGVVFGHPVDGGGSVARHPVQLYEALFYFTFLALLYGLRKKFRQWPLLVKPPGSFLPGPLSIVFASNF
jgi:phosphatidylglycerol---prolipoprotein diacylglyceryl transferase